MTTFTCTFEEFKGAAKEFNDAAPTLDECVRMTHSMTEFAGEVAKKVDKDGFIRQAHSSFKDKYCMKVVIVRDEGYPGD